MFVGRLIGFSGGLLKNSPILKKVFTTAYVPLPKAYQVMKLDCSILLHRIDKSADYSHDLLPCRDTTTYKMSYKAKALYPEFPGIMNAPSWEIGRTWDKSRGPECSGSYIRDLYPTVVGGK